MSGSARQGTKRVATFRERGADLHQTPPQAVIALLRVCPVPWRVWEPAAGLGAIARVVAHTGRQVIASDLVAYDGADSGIVAPVDFLRLKRAPKHYHTIVTNPPYTIADDFVRHGLTLCERVIVLQRLAAIEGVNRSDLVDRNLRIVYAGMERLPMMHRHDWQGARIANTTAPFGWFVFQREPRHTKRFEVERISWRVPVPLSLRQHADLARATRRDSHGQTLNATQALRAQA